MKVEDVPTDWIHSLVVVVLHAVAKRTTHGSITLEEAIMSVKSLDKYFAAVNVAKGYLQVELMEEASWLTVFLSPFGYRFLRMPSRPPRPKS